MEFWHNRWSTNNIGWHRSEFNDFLVKHWTSLSLEPKTEVLVPLCGKSLDMAWLAQQDHSIVGLELVDQAVKSFFDEGEMDPQIETIGAHVRYSCPPYTLIQGDFFTLSAETVQADAWYDRAAMIALPPAVREAYVEQIRHQTKTGAVGLLITYAYPQHERPGPTFALHDEDVERLFSNGFEVERLENIELEDERDRGLSSITSSAYKITRV